MQGAAVGSRVLDPAQDDEDTETVQLDASIVVMGACPKEYEGKTFEITFDENNGETRVNDVAASLLPDPTNVDLPLKTAQVLAGLLATLDAAKLLQNNPEGSAALHLFASRLADAEDRKSQSEVP